MCNPTLSTENNGDTIIRFNIKAKQVNTDSSCSKYKKNISTCFWRYKCFDYDGFSS